MSTIWKTLYKIIRQWIENTGALYAKTSNKNEKLHHFTLWPHKKRRKNKGTKRKYEKDFVC